MRPAAGRKLAAGLLLLTTLAACAYSTLPLAEPVPKLEPPASVPEPAAREQGKMAWWAFTDVNFFYPVKWLFDVPLHLQRALGMQQRALDVDALDEVPDSNWFTNRNPGRPVSPQELEQGTEPPPAAGTWTVTGGKQGGIQPGFAIKDSAGNKFIMKLDVAAYPEMATSAEAITERFFHAAGYNVPGVSVVYFDRERLAVAPGATYVTSDGFTCPLTPAALDSILECSPRTREGRWRAAAVSFVKGKLKGRFSFLGTRADDMNDTIAHQHRRELRALTVIASFVNDIDIIDNNTLDTYITVGGKSYLKHYLLDFGTSLGSYAFIYMPRRAGHEYAIDWGMIGKRLASLGAYSAPYEGEKLDIRPEVGFIDLKGFDPGRWKAEYPCPAASYLTAADAFWAARIIASFSDEQIGAAVRSARLTDPASTAYLTQALIARRNAVAAYWFGRVSPLTSFEVAGQPGEQLLRFRDLAVEHGLEPAQGSSYEVVVAATGAHLTLAAGEHAVPLARLENLPATPFELRLSAVRAQGRRLPPVRVRLRRGPSGFELMGVEHDG
jgi:hypothetical protein